MTDSPHTPQPTTFHRILGAITLIVLLGMAVLDGLEWFDAGETIAVILAVSYIILLGFGSIIRAYLEAKYGHD